MNRPRDMPLLTDAPALPAVTDDPRHIGVSIPREGVRRLVQGRGRYVDDIVLPRMLHVVFWRSQVAHCRITRIDASAVRAMPGVAGVFDGHDLARVCKPWVATLAHLAGIKSAPQYPLALDRACWQGEPVVAIVAETRVQAEDALQQLQVEWEDLPAVLDTETALDPATPATTGSPCQQARSIASACWGADFMPARWPSVATQGLQIAATSAPSTMASTPGSIRA